MAQRLAFGFWGVPWLADALQATLRWGLVYRLLQVLDRINQVCECEILRKVYLTCQLRKLTYSKGKRAMV